MSSKERVHVRHVPAKQTALVQNTSAVRVVLLPHSNVRAASNTPGKGSRQSQHARGCWRGSGEQNSHPLGAGAGAQPRRGRAASAAGDPRHQGHPPPDLGSPVRGGSCPGQGPPEAWCRNTSPGSSAWDASDPQSKRSGTVLVQDAQTDHPTRSGFLPRGVKMHSVTLH